MAKPDSTAVVALLAKRVAELQQSLAELVRQPGPAGVNGKDGLDGKDGRDGKDGLDGKDGRDGKDGLDGKDGRNGADGKDGAVGPAPKHEWRGTKLRFQQPDGAWGKLVDLQGPKGERGPTGYSSGGGFDPSGSGGAGFDPSGLGIATDMPLPTEMLVQQGGVWVRATWAQIVGWLGGVVPPSGGGVILTEDGLGLLAEDGSTLVTESATPSTAGWVLTEDGGVLLTEDANRLEME